MNLIYYSTYRTVIHPIGEIPGPIATLLDTRSTRLPESYLTHTRLYCIHLLLIYYRY
jgi:hypothetical protein